ncbi:sce7726 family protein [uncultured Tateyamaria sp.]|uniref:sce7726 family protein n=1 Tax=uncultured Tateyamaria sp. TaxID=455651 RepID=UPI0026273633|nr:sce7726 family protein [uncultured Tateyamaria sp.]
MNKQAKTDVAFSATEPEIRTALAQFLISEFGGPKPLLASEVRYGSEQRRADLVLINEYSHAFEIKSDYDTTVRLSGQLEEYSQTFDYTLVVTTSAHIDRVRKIAPRKVGLLLYKNGAVTLLRRPQQSKRLSKPHLAASISKTTLLEALPNIRRATSAEQVRDIAATTLTTPTLRSLFFQEMHHRFAKSSALFFSETDFQLNIEDLSLLRREARLYS